MAAGGIDLQFTGHVALFGRIDESHLIAGMRNFLWRDIPAFVQRKSNRQVKRPQVFSRLSGALFARR